MPVAGSGSLYTTYGGSSSVTTLRWYLDGRPLGGVRSSDGHVTSSMLIPEAAFHKPICEGTFVLINPCLAELTYLNFQPLDVVDRDPQRQVVEITHD